MTLGLTFITIVSVVSLIAALTLSKPYHFGPPAPGGGFIFLGVAAALPVWILWKTLVFMRQGVDRPIVQLSRALMENRTHFMLSAFLYGLLLCNGYSFTILKNLIPLLNPFWADPALANIERSLFGQDLWVYSHRAIGAAGTRALEFFYIAWQLINAIVMLWLIFTRDYETKILSFSVLALTWMFLGGVMAVAFSSVGPVLFDHFYGGDRFAGLLSDLHAADAITLKARQFLLDEYGTGVLGSGVSAMPSLHVANAFLWFLIARRKSQALGYAAAIFCVLILVGSVHLGWHWLSDGVVSIIAVYGFWRFAGFAIRAPRQQPSRVAQPA